MRIIYGVPPTFRMGKGGTHADRLLRTLNKILNEVTKGYGSPNEV